MQRLILILEFNNFSLSKIGGNGLKDKPLPFCYVLQNKKYNNGSRSFRLICRI